jgi:enoyl-CoA hydratase/carnithine racemase
MASLRLRLLGTGSTSSFAKRNVRWLSKHVLVDIKESVTTVTLNHPEKHNALSPSMVESLLHIFNQSKTNDTKLLVLKGNGRSLCAGFDFSGIEAQSDADLALRFIRLEELLQTVYHAPFQTLALIHGACYGAGADLAVSCSFRVSTNKAKFRMPGLKFGVVLGTHRLSHIVGMNNARNLLETCRVFHAEEALKCGFVNALVEEDQWNEVIEDRSIVAGSLEKDMQRYMLDRTRIADSRDSDLAALTRSVAVPGIKQRILSFIESK